ncbi:MAG: cell wall metabolism sensor histidine kinase WalK [Ruminiclostridium sp.]|nr:cell wall metabolism sensor histidine kinase WalK [Ruminiclostridium sp.]
MFLKSLQWRLVSFFCLVTFCLIIPIGLFLNKQVEDSYYKKFKEDIQFGFKKGNIDSGNPNQQELLDELTASGKFFSANELDKSYTITDKKGKFIASNDKYFLDNPGAVTGVLLKSDNFLQAMAGGEGGKQILEKFGDTKFFDYARPKGDYIIYFKYDDNDWIGIIENFNDIIFTGLLVAMAVAFFLGYFLSKTITAPLARLMNKARSIAAGDFDQLLEVKASNDEISKLTETFNFMAISLKDNLTQISSEKNKMETIFNYMTDGIIAFNINGRVIHTNPASRRILGEEELIYDFDYYAKRFGIDYSIEDVLYLSSNRSGEVTIKISDRSVRVYFAVFTDEKKKPGGIIAVLQDITEQERLENMRKEFVANVSHELKTPLTSIKSYAETLLDGALDDRESAERFLGVINSEADRMTRLVKDLLQLSSLDNRQLKWNMEEMSFVSLVKNAVEKMEMEAGNKKQTLESHVIGIIPNIEADYGRIEQVVFNLLSNAIKYTPENGKISVYIGKTKNEVYMKVSDTGIGIPENDLPRIFERFYRVDKARSREMGGTGLGLAIAREIVEAHSGIITISSEKDKGTEVLVRLPVRQGKQKAMT